ncbi:M1 family peptidase [bacterium]|nr:MAG: M1 family peptidase [bacterium]
MGIQPGRRTPKRLRASYSWAMMGDLRNGRMRRNDLNRKLSLAVLPLLAASAGAQRPTATGGPLRFEQAVFDVQMYDVTLAIDPKTKTIKGTTVMTAKTVIPTDVILLDLDTPFTVSKVTDGAGNSLKFERGKDTIRIWFPQSKQVGQTIKTSIVYSGTPRLAPNPPWTGGFMWKTTPSGAPWVSVALQNDGADLMFPVKDHPSDKASVAAMHLTVPDPLVAVGPGKLENVVKNPGGTSTYNWRMSVPVANYSIVFNAAPYKLIESTAKSVDGSTMPIEFYVLPEHFEKGPSLIAETKKYLAFYEKYLGPYAFRTQKLGIVETPHLGMEHSTAIAYGNGFRYNKDGTDWLMLHEFGHEWWANLVTASDWKDFWIHEGFQSYMDSLYQEHLHGQDAYLESMRGRVAGLKNRQPVAPREAKIAYEVYMAEPDYANSDGDIYGKGALILHALRYLIGDEAFFRSLRRMAYPTKEMEKITTGGQERLVTTDDFLTIAEKESGQDLDWFFELYLRQPKLPVLVTKIEGNTLSLQWETPGNIPFPMPIDVLISGKIQRVPMKDGKGSLSVAFTGIEPVIDPKGWVLKAKQSDSLK